MDREGAEGVTLFCAAGPVKHHKRPNRDGSNSGFGRTPRRPWKTSRRRRVPARCDRRCTRYLSMRCMAGRGGHPSCLCIAWRTLDSIACALRPGSALGVTVDRAGSTEVVIEGRQATAQKAWHTRRPCLIGKTSAVKQRITKLCDIAGAAFVYYSGGWTLSATVWKRAVAHENR